MSDAREAGANRVGRLAVLALPALLIGVLSALTLWALDELADALQDTVWKTIPAAAGIDPDSGWWIVLILTLTGAAVGGCVWLLPGHGGPDSATTELVSEPVPWTVVPSLALVTVLALAGGVSLGPENPIVAINAGVAVALAARLIPRVPGELIMLMAASGTIGALFGTPVGAALVLTGAVAAVGTGALWDRLFLPLAAAVGGSLTMTLLAHPTFGIDLPAYTTVHWLDLVSGTVVIVAATVIGLAGAWMLPGLHRAFHAVRNLLLMSLLGGLVLGVLGVIGGPITLFKGLTQLGELIAERGSLSPGQVALILIVKLAALLVAASAGFRGGRVFPAVFLGAAVGVLALSLAPGIPPALAVGAGIAGFTLAATRDGWISLFIAAIIVPSPVLLPVLCLLVLPAWLLVSAGPKLLVAAPPVPRAAARIR